MPALRKFTLVTLLFIANFVLIKAQESSIISGTIVSDTNNPIPYAIVAIKNSHQATQTDALGHFKLETTQKPPFTLQITILDFESKEIEIETANDINKLSRIVLKQKSTEIEGVQITGQKRTDNSFQQLDAKHIQQLPDASGGNIESLVKTQMGVTSNSELSSQYRVRGGNFDENMVYLNDVEIYRPFLVRSGQQEGLSVVNPDMVNDIYFSAGGFDTKYNDKMSSVLDITYKKPTSFAASASASLLGATAHAEGSSKNQKFTAIVGTRYKTSKLLLGTFDTEGEYDPRFIDLQTYLTYAITPKWEVAALGYFGQTDYNFVPVDRTTTFGTLTNIQQLKIYFEGQEKDRFISALGTLSLTFKPTPQSRYKLYASNYTTSETETFDILGQYWLQELDAISGESTSDAQLENGNSKDYGTYLEHARNELDGNISSYALRGINQLTTQKLTWEVKYQNEQFKENLNEWNYLDSAGYSLPYNNQTVNLDYIYRAHLDLNTNRFTAFVQDDITFDPNSGKLWLSGGLRANFWDFNNELLISPRASITYEPEWDHKFQFKFATGIYYQSPFFKELYTPSGEINENIKAQKSIHFLIGSNYFFKVSDRPFKFTTELYYKHLTDIIPYNVDNVRVKYLGYNNAKGYAAGLDMKLNGELVPGLESWATLSFMKTEEDILNDSIVTKNSDGSTSVSYPGYIPRPSDQRVNFSLFFQDYIPRYPSFKVHLNLLFGTGLPFGPPDSPRYKATLRMPPYRRVDIGFSKELTGSQNHPDKVWGPVKKLWLGVDVFNLLNISNTISYYWVTDIRSNQYAVPNYMTSRRVNVKIVANF